MAERRRHQSIKASASREQVRGESQPAHTASCSQLLTPGRRQEAVFSRRSASLVAALTACTVASPAHALLGVGGGKKDPIEEYKENTVRRRQRARHCP